MIENERIFVIKKAKSGKKCLIYFIRRDFRSIDNYALNFAIDEANKLDLPLVALIFFSDELPHNNFRHLSFFADGIFELQEDLAQLNIQTSICINDEELISTIKELDPHLIVTDFNPLKEQENLLEIIEKNTTAPVVEIDSHNIVPARYVSNKIEFAAYTIRPKINKLLDKFLIDIPKPEAVKKALKSITFQAERINEILETTDKSISKINIKSGGKAAHNILQHFIEKKISKYNEFRNEPALDWQSHLSPYLNYGFISAQRVALEIMKLKQDENTAAYLEELIIRRELSDNFCHYNKNYDSLAAAPEWAKKTIDEHRADLRNPVFTLEQLENAKTYDEAWNAAQLELHHKGRMHGYMRMYWAKKILEWTESPEQAFEFAIYLNDKYALDGRNPNGFVGVAWSIAGVHDRAWTERPIFGKIRYMNFSGLKRKFDIEKYISMQKNLRIG